MKTGVVLLNLGTPAAPTVPAIRRYLRDFLSDPRVVEIPRPLWLPILYGPILTFRPRRIAPAYAALWQEYGDSPLRLISQRQVQALRELLQVRLGDAAPRVELAMTYGEPSLASAIAALRDDGAEQLLVLPLYPQYSATTTGAVYDQVTAVVRAARDIPAIHVVRDYHAHPRYLDTLADSVRRFWAEAGQGERLLMSFHGIPQRNVDLGDPYYRQCHATATALALRLGLPAEAWGMSFQSRLGRAQWLQPYTAELLEQWGRQRVGRIDVICPAFAVDCLETLEEMAIENKGVFQSAGGGDYRYIPCLNDEPAHIELFAALIAEQMPGMPLAHREKLL